MQRDVGATKELRAAAHDAHRALSGAGRRLVRRRAGGLLLLVFVLDWSRPGQRGQLGVAELLVPVAVQPYMAHRPTGGAVNLHYEISVLYLTDVPLCCVCWGWGGGLSGAIIFYGPRLEMHTESAAGCTMVTESIGIQCCCQHVGCCAHGCAPRTFEERRAVIRPGQPEVVPAGRWSN